MGHMLNLGLVSLFACSVQLLQGQLHKSDTPCDNISCSRGCTQNQADMKQSIMQTPTHHERALKSHIHGSQAAWLTRVLRVQLMQQHDKDAEVDTGVDHKAVRAAGRDAPGKFRTIRDEETMQLLVVAASIPAEAPPFIPRVPPTSPIFERSIQEEVAANTNRLPPAKEKAANEKASMVSSRCTTLGMATDPCCLQSFSVGTQWCCNLLVVRFSSRS